MPKASPSTVVHMNQVAKEHKHAHTSVGYGPCDSMGWTGARLLDSQQIQFLLGLEICVTSEGMGEWEAAGS